LLKNKIIYKIIFPELNFENLEFFSGKKLKKNKSKPFDNGVLTED